MKRDVTRVIVLGVCALSFAALAGNATPTQPKPPTKTATPQPASLTEPSYAVHPLIVVGAEPKLEAELRADFEKLLEKLELKRVDAAEVDAFFTARGQPTCDQTDCLAALARATKADYALKLTIAPKARIGDKPKIILTGKLVQPTGVESLSRVRDYPADKVTPKVALDNFLRAELALGEVDVTPLTPEVQTRTITNTVTNTVLVKEKRPWKTPVLIATGAIAILAAGAGSYFEYACGQDWAKSDDLVAASHTTAMTNARLDELKAVQNSARANQGLATTAFVVSAASAGALAATWLLTRDDDRKPVITPTVTPAGPGVLMRVEF